MYTYMCIYIRHRASTHGSAFLSSSPAGMVVLTFSLTFSHAKALLLGPNSRFLTGSVCFVFWLEPSEGPKMPPRWLQDGPKTPTDELQDVILSSLGMPLTTFCDFGIVF